MFDRLADQVDKHNRDLVVLQTVIEQAPIGIVRLADETGYPQHKVRYSLRMLENDDLVEPTPRGAIPGDDIDRRLVEINEGIDRLVRRTEGLR